MPNHTLVLRIYNPIRIISGLVNITSSTVNIVPEKNLEANSNIFILLSKINF